MKKIVVIGGGTGSYTVLSGLKKYDVDITAIVSMFDSGGSTGILRDEFGVLPPGDVRRCLVALAKENGDNMMRRLFTYRFDADCSLQGHSFGNLLLTALTKITGSDVGAIKKASEILNIKGKVLPVSIDDAHICAELDNGEIIKGETNIDIPKHDGNVKIKRIFLEPDATAYGETIAAIKDADMIVICPGDLYTSVLPNLLVEGVAEAIRASSAKVVYVGNLMTKWGETHGFTASDHVAEIVRYLGKKVDVFVVNDKEMSVDLVEKYEGEKAYPVVLDREKVKEYAHDIVTADLLKEPTLVRHDADKLASVLVGL